jgi:hypothetical protein
MTVEPSPAAVRPDRLTEVLRRAGALRSGQISSVEILHSRSTVLSRIIRLRLIYDGDVSKAPSTLIFKTGLPERLGNENWDAGRQVADVEPIGSQCRPASGTGTAVVVGAAGAAASGRGQG